MKKFFIFLGVLLVLFFILKLVPLNTKPKPLPQNIQDRINSELIKWEKSTEELKWAYLYGNNIILGFEDPLLHKTEAGSIASLCSMRAEGSIHVYVCDVKRSPTVAYAEHVYEVNDFVYSVSASKGKVKK